MKTFNAVVTNYEPSCDMYYVTVNVMETDSESAQRVDVVLDYSLMQFTMSDEMAKREERNSVLDGDAFANVIKTAMFEASVYHD